MESFEKSVVEDESDEEEYEEEESEISDEEYEEIECCRHRDVLEEEG